MTMLADPPADTAEDLTPVAVAPLPKAEDLTPVAVEPVRLRDVASSNETATHKEMQAHKELEQGISKFTDEYGYSVPSNLPGVSEKTNAALKEKATPYANREDIDRANAKFVYQRGDMTLSEKMAVYKNLYDQHQAKVEKRSDEMIAQGKAFGDPLHPYSKPTFTKDEMGNPLDANGQRIAAEHYAEIQNRAQEKLLNQASGLIKPGAGGIPGQARESAHEGLMGGGLLGTISQGAQVATGTSPEDVARQWQNQKVLERLRDKEHPWIAGASNMVGQMIRPENLAAAAASGGIGEMAGGGILGHAVGGGVNLGVMSTGSQIDAGEAPTPVKNFGVGAIVGAAGGAAGKTVEGITDRLGAIGKQVSRTAGNVVVGGGTNVVLGAAQRGKDETASNAAGDFIAGAVPGLAMEAPGIGQSITDARIAKTSEYAQHVKEIFARNPDMPIADVHKLAGELTEMNRGGVTGDTARPVAGATRGEPLPVTGDENTPAVRVPTAEESKPSEFGGYAEDQAGPADLTPVAVEPLPKETTDADRISAQGTENAQAKSEADTGGVSSRVPIQGDGNKASEAPPAPVEPAAVPGAALTSPKIEPAVGQIWTDPSGKRVQIRSVHGDKGMVTISPEGSWSGGGDLYIEQLHKDFTPPAPTAETVKPEQAFDQKGYASKPFVREIRKWAEANGMELKDETSIGGASQYLTLIDADNRSVVTRMRISNHREGLGYADRPSGDASIDLRNNMSAAEKHKELSDHLDFIATEGLYDPVPKFSSREAIPPAPTAETVKQPWETSFKDYLAQKKAQYSHLDAEELADQEKAWRSQYLNEVMHAPRDAKISIDALHELHPDGRESLLKTHPSAVDAWMDSIGTHKLTYRQFLKQRNESGLTSGDDTRALHRAAVKRAIDEGKIDSHPDYPDLAKKSPAPAGGALKSGVASGTLSNHGNDQGINQNSGRESENIAGTASKGGAGVEAARRTSDIKNEKKNVSNSATENAGKSTHQDQGKSPILDRSNDAGESAGTPINYGETTGEKTQNDGTRSPQERQRPGQQVGKSRTPQSLSALKNTREANSGKGASGGERPLEKSLASEASPARAAKGTLEGAGGKALKPRLAESGDDLYRAIVKKTDEGVVGPEGKVLFPIVRVIGEGDFSVTSKGIEKITGGGRLTTKATDAQAQSVHDAITGDQAQVLLMSRWGGSGGEKATRSKAVSELHSPSGLAFKSLDEVLAAQRGKPSSESSPTPKATDKTRAAVETLHRETSPDAARDILKSDRTKGIETAPAKIHFASDRALATGQGDNAGVHMEFEPGFKTTEKTSKPSAEFAAKQGLKEFEAAPTQKEMRDNLRAVELPKAMADEAGLSRNSGLARELKRLQDAGWTRTDTGDVARFEKPSGGKSEGPGAAAESDKNFITNAYEQDMGTSPARKAIQNIGDALSTEVIPRLRRAGVLPEAVAHAKARDAVMPKVRSLLAKVFPTKYRDATFTARVVDLINKDNILGGYDEFYRRAESEKAKGNEVGFNANIKKADAIDSTHDIAAIEDEVLAAKDDPQLKASIARWKEFVNPEMDRLYNEMKRLDPNEPQESRGRHFGARINLISEEHLPEWQKALKETDRPLPEVGNASNYRNPDVKRDKFDRAATYTGKYATDAETVLAAALARRMNEVTKLRFIEALQKQGVAWEDKPGEARPEKLKGEDVARMEIKVPETDYETGVTKTAVHNLWIQKGLVGETKAVLGLEDQPHAPLMQSIGKVLTNIQLAGVVDFVAHTSNLERGVANALGSKSAAMDLLRKVPGIGTAHAITKVSEVVGEIFKDTPEIRDEISRMADAGLLRGYYPHKGVTSLIPTSKVIQHADFASRIIMNRFFSNLVERGLAKDTPENRFQFVGGLGEYNRRLLGPVTRIARDLGFSPFVIAGQTFNKAGRRWLTGAPGFEANDTAGALKARAMMTAGVVLATTIPMMFNAVTVGTPMGRPGTPVGAIDTGKTDKDGKPIVWDIMQLTGSRRGARSLGLNALVEGLRQGKDSQTIMGNMATDILQTVMHPWAGPAPAFVVKAVTGMQPDIRGRMDAQRIPGVDKTSPRQLLENTRAATESQNPLIYGFLRPWLQKAGIDQTPPKTMAQSVGVEGLAKPVLGALGIKSVSPPSSAAEDMAKRLVRDKFGDGQLTPDDARRIALKRDLLADIKGGDEQTTADAVARGDITERMAANLHEKAGKSSLEWNLKNLDVEDAGRVFEAATPAEKATIEKAFRDKIANSKTTTTAEKMELYDKYGIRRPTMKFSNGKLVPNIPKK